MVQLSPFFLVLQVQFRVNENEGILWLLKAMNLSPIVTLYR